jgi:hypothetical protein
VSDQERDQAVKLLGEHAAVGRLTLDELEERVSVALVAKTRGELEAQLRDLPIEAGVPAGRRSARHWMVAVLGGSHRRGRFRLQSAVNVVAILGGDDIDLRDAELDGGEVTLKSSRSWVALTSTSPTPSRSSSVASRSWAVTASTALAGGHDPGPRWYGSARTT